MYLSKLQVINFMLHKPILASLCLNSAYFQFSFLSFPTGQFPLNYSTYILSIIGLNSFQFVSGIFLLRNISGSMQSYLTDYMKIKIINIAAEYFPLI